MTRFNSEGSCVYLQVHLHRISSVVVFSTTSSSCSSTCPPAPSAMWMNFTSLSCWMVFWNSVPVKTRGHQTRARRTAPTAKGHRLQNLRERGANQPLCANQRPMVWPKRASRSRGTRRTRAKERGCACWAKPSPGWRRLYRGFRRTPNSPSWTPCDWPPATSRTCDRYSPMTNTRMATYIRSTWWETFLKICTEKSTRKQDAFMVYTVDYVQCKMFPSLTTYLFPIILTTISASFYFRVFRIFQMVENLTLAALWFYLKKV